MPPQTDDNLELDNPPVDEPSSAVEGGDEELIITVEGRGKPRLPSGAITALAVLAASAFICPGIGLVAVALLPIGLVAAAAVYYFAPHVLKHPAGTQRLKIGADELRLIESCPRTFDGDDDDTEVTTVSRSDIDAVELVLEPDETDGDDAGIRIRYGDNETMVFGTPLVAKSGHPHGDDEHRELEWLFSVVESQLRSEAGLTQAPVVEGVG